MKACGAAACKPTHCSHPSHQYSPPEPPLPLPQQTGRKQKHASRTSSAQQAAPVLRSCSSTRRRAVMPAPTVPSSPGRWLSAYYVVNATLLAALPAACYWFRTATPEGSTHSSVHSVAALAAWERQAMTAYASVVGFQVCVCVFVGRQGQALLSHRAPQHQLSTVCGSTHNHPSTNMLHCTRCFGGARGTTGRSRCSSTARWWQR